MTNYEQWQLEKYGNIISDNGEKNDRELTTGEKFNLLLQQVKENNHRILDMINEMPDSPFKVNCLQNLYDINERVLNSIKNLTE